MRSVILQQHFDRLVSNREVLFRTAPVLSPAELWQRPEPDRWSIGETLQHLTKMIRLFRRLSVAAVVLQRPIAALRRGRPYPARSRDIFSGAARRAPRLVHPRRPPRDVPWEAAIGALRHETESLQRLLAPHDEALLGHIWLWDPVMGAQNMLQMVDLLAIHEEHHLRILQTRWRWE